MVNVSAEVKGTVTLARFDVTPLVVAVAEFTTCPAATSAAVTV